MNLTQVIAVYMLLLLSSAKTTPHIISSTSTLLAQTVAEDVNKSWMNVRAAQKYVDQFEVQLSDLNSEIKQLNSKIEFIQSNSISFTSRDTIYFISKTWTGPRTKLLTDLTGLINRLNSLYQFFALYNEKQHEIQNTTIIDLALSTVSNDSGAVSSLLDRIYDIQSDVISIITYVLKNSNSYVCDLKQSNQQLLYNFYNMILLAEIKGYSMMQFSWMILELHGKGGFELEIDMSKQRHDKRVKNIIASLKRSSKGVSRQFWRCDPDYHVEGKTYTQLTRLLQGYIENEVDMNDEGTCRENCAYYQYGFKNHGCYAEQFCSTQPACTGRIYKCQFVESNMLICMASRNSNRRYEWIQYFSGETYGKKGYCYNGKTLVYSWFRWFWHCSYCFCICDQSGPLSDRYFSVKAVTSNIFQNMVITGLRFIKKNRVIHLQISQGKLLPGSIIDTKTVQWLDVEPIDVRFVRENDYCELSYYSREIDLDDLEGYSDYLLTGVRFRKIGTHIRFEIRVTSFNYTNGKLDTNRNYWHNNGDYRSKLYIGHPDVPTATSKKSTIDSGSYQYLQFDHTGFKSDFAQTTVPFIDTQDVLPTNPIPLTGAGIYHKGTPGYGGFIAPKVFTYDYAKHVEDVHFTTENEIDEN